ncbi:hypothetical protein M2651_05560 [Clostridium sp. SYSU_GA19001]|uniref:hypothetical protein n=1 Tax=Clostridium caldaquaticum TaxID=2940653 RepID=UPI002077031C|nr:hypothetical protein [Clostridium caldaquaticum]MCM8710491.1 hypothetical protein [Clostridium caldaquaticum]
MENEKIFELMTKMYSEMHEGFSGIKYEINNIKGEINNIKGEINNIKGEIKEINIRLTKIETAQEDIKTKVVTLAEIQQSFSEQLDRAKNKEGKTLGERLDIIELAVSNTSKSLSENFIKLNNKVDDLQIDVNTLTSKTAKTDTKVIEFERLLNEKKQG